VNVLGALGRDVLCAHELHVQGVFGTNVQGIIWCLHMNDIRTLPILPSITSDVPETLLCTYTDRHASGR
jgi:hypothetical protein